MFPYAYLWLSAGAHLSLPACRKDMEKKQVNKHEKNSDIFGRAIKAYYLNGDEEDILVHSPDFDDDIIPVKYLFRNYDGMPLLEQTAIEHSSGKVLDIGCGAGSHALYLQNERNLSITAIDTSEGAIEVCRLRGIKDARVTSFQEFSGEKFDTLLLLMNGTGIVGKLENLYAFFEKLKTLLNPGGQVLIDSSDLSYLFEGDEDGGIWLDASAGYYGELLYRLTYKNESSATFNWLYVDFNTLNYAASLHGFSCELLKDGEHYDYLAKLSIETE